MGAKVVKRSARCAFCRLGCFLGFWAEGALASRGAPSQVVIPDYLDGVGWVSPRGWSSLLTDSEVQDGGDTLVEDGWC